MNLDFYVSCFDSLMGRGPSCRPNNFMCIWTTTEPRVRLLQHKTGLSPPVIYYWPFKGDASVVVYSNCHCSFAFCSFLAHLSQRLTRWAYSIPMVRPPSNVVRCHCSHFQTWISLKPFGQSWSNFMCSVTGVGERLHKVLGQNRSKLWFPWQQKAPIDL